MSIGLYIVLAPLYLKSVRKLQEKRFVFVKILAIIIPENGAKVSKIKCFQFAQQTLSNYYEGQLKKDGSGDYVTGKGDKINHGLGLKSVRTIVESYGGLMEISSEDFIFQVSILI